MRARAYFVAPAAQAAATCSGMVFFCLVRVPTHVRRLRARHVRGSKKKEQWCTLDARIALECVAQTRVA